MASTSSSPSEATVSPSPNWLELPEELTSSILRRLEPLERLEVAQKVCVTWQRICSDPVMWQSIDMGNIWWDYPKDVWDMCKLAVDWSRGGLREISLGCFANEDLLNYIAARAPQLRSLQLAYCNISAETMAEVAKKLPNLEELHMYLVMCDHETFENIGRLCPQLKSLTYNIDDFDPDGDEEAVAIAQTMPGLRHLSLVESIMTNVGLQAILDACPRLESLDLRRCHYIDLEGDLGKICAQRIKNLKLPSDSLDAGYEYTDFWATNLTYYVDLPWYYRQYKQLEYHEPVEILETIMPNTVVRGRTFSIMIVRCRDSKKIWESDERLSSKYPQLFNTQGSGSG